MADAGNPRAAAANPGANVEQRAGNPPPTASANAGTVGGVGSVAGGNQQVTRRTGVFGSLIDWDEEISARLAVCTTPTSSLGWARPLMKLLELTGNDGPWVCGMGIAIGIAIATRAQSQLTTVNLLFLLLLDTAILLTTKAIVRRPRPRHNLGENVMRLSDIYSFPSGHSTRALAATTFVISQYDCSTVSIVLLVTWATCLCMSRVMLGRHHLLDIVTGMAIGALECLVYVRYLSVSPDS